MGPAFPPRRRAGVCCVRNGTRDLLSSARSQSETVLDRPRTVTRLPIAQLSHFFHRFGPV